MTLITHPRRFVPLIAIGALCAIALAAVACGSGTSSSDKTSTAVASGGGASSSPSAQTSPTEEGEESEYATQTAAAASGTPAAGTTASASGGGGPAMVNAKAAPAGTTLMDETGATLTQYLTDAQGNTLYYFKNDVANSGKSAVPTAIAANWPPLTTSGTAAAGAGVTGTLGTITTAGGATQVTYNGKPLYYFKGDTAPGDTKGEGIGGIWFVVGP